MRKQEQEQLMKLLGKYCRETELYKLIDLLAIMHRTTVNDSIPFSDFMRIQLADYEQK